MLKGLLLAIQGIFKVVFISKASESAEQVAELWLSTDEDLRNAARETVLSFGNWILNH